MSLEATIIAVAVSLVIVGLWFVNTLNAQKERDKKSATKRG